MAKAIHNTTQANSFADAFQLGAGAARGSLDIMMTNTTGMIRGLFSLLKHAPTLIGPGLGKCGMPF